MKGKKLLFTAVLALLLSLVFATTAFAADADLPETEPVISADDSSVIEDGDDSEGLPPADGDDITADADNNDSSDVPGDGEADSSSDIPGDGDGNDSSDISEDGDDSEGLPPADGEEAEGKSNDASTGYEIHFGEDQQVTIQGGGTTPLADILTALGIEGEVTAATGSNDALFTLSQDENGVWMFHSHNAFSTEQTMTLVVGGEEVVVRVTDGNVKAVIGNNQTEHDTINAAIQEAGDATEIRISLKGDVTEDITIAAGKTVTIDLDNNTLTGNIINNGTLTILNDSGSDRQINGNLTNYGTATIDLLNLTLNGDITNSGNLTINASNYYGGVNGTVTNTGTVEIFSTSASGITTLENSGEARITGAAEVNTLNNKSGGSVTITDGGYVSTLNNHSGSVTITGNGYVATLNNSGGSVEVTGGGDVVTLNNHSGSVTITDNGYVSTLNNAFLKDGAYQPGGTVTVSNSGTFSTRGVDTLITAGENAVTISGTGLVKNLTSHGGNVIFSGIGNYLGVVNMDAYGGTISADEKVTIHGTLTIHQKLDSFTDGKNKAQIGTLVLYADFTGNIGDFTTIQSKLNTPIFVNGRVASKTATKYEDLPYGVEDIRTPGKYYVTVEDAVAMGAGGVKLLGNEDAVNLTLADKAITIDLNGKTINTLNNSSNFSVVYVNGGTVKALTNHGLASIMGGTVETLTNNGNFSVVCVYGGTVKALTNHGLASIMGGTVETLTNNSSDSVADVKGGTVTTLNNQNGGTAKVTGGTVTTLNNSGTANITGGTFTDVNNSSGGKVTIDGSTVTTLTNSGTVTVKNGGIIESLIGNAGCTVIVMGGTVTVTDGTVTTLNNESGTANVNGGTVTTLTNNSVANVSGGTVSTLTNNSEVNVSGGTVSTLTNNSEANVSGGTVSTLTNNSEANVSGGTVTTLNNSDKVEVYGTGTVTTLYHKDSESTLSITENGTVGELVLEADITLQTNVDVVTVNNAELTIAIDLNGKTIDNLVIYNSTVTVKGTGMITTLDSNGTANVSGGTVTKLNNSAAVSVSGGTVTTLNNRSGGTANVTSGTVTTLDNDDEVTIDGGTVTTLKNQGGVTVTGGIVDRLENGVKFYEGNYREWITNPGGEATIQGGEVKKLVMLTEFCTYTHTNGTLGLVEFECNFAGTVADSQQVQCAEKTTGDELSIGKLIIGNRVLESKTPVAYNSLPFAVEDSESGKKYADVNAAADAGVSTVKLLGDMGTVTVNSGKTITIDLNGKTITTLDNSGTITVTGTSGEVTTLNNKAKGEATLSGGSVHNLYNENSGSVVINDGASCTGYIETYDSSTMTINGGSIGAEIDTYDSSKLTIQNGTFDDEIDSHDNSEVVIYNGTFNEEVESRDSSTMTIHNGTFTEDLNARGDSSLTVNGGSFDLQADSVDNATMTINGGTFTQITECLDSSTMIINDGTFSDDRDDKDVAFRVRDTGSATINGGSFLDSIVVEENGSLNITGGTIAVLENSGETQIKGGEVTEANNEGTVTVSGNGEVTALNNKTDGEAAVKGGEIGTLDNDGNATITGGTVDTLDNSGDAEVKGGTVTDVNNSGEGSVTISGGFFGENVGEFVDPESGVVAEKDGVYAVGDSIWQLPGLEEEDAQLTFVHTPAGGMNLTIEDVPENLVLRNDTEITIYINNHIIAPGAEGKLSDFPVRSFARYYVLKDSRDQHWTKGSEALRFLLNKQGVIKVLIDEEEVEFTVTENGEIEIAIEILDTLELGEHEITFVFEDGECATTFTID